MRRATLSGFSGQLHKSDFYPRPPRGGRHPLTVPLIELGYVFLSTPSVRRATDLLDFTELVIEISIHALREEGDPQRRTSSAAPAYFYPRPPRGGRLGRAERPNHAGFISIHALREEGDGDALPGAPSFLLFLSTPSARRATSRFRTASAQCQYFYPRPP